MSIPPHSNSFQPDFRFYDPNACSRPYALHPAIPSVSMNSQQTSYISPGAHSTSGVPQTTFRSTYQAISQHIQLAQHAQSSNVTNDAFETRLKAHLEPVCGSLAILGQRQLASHDKITESLLATKNEIMGRQERLESRLAELHTIVKDCQERAPFIEALAPVVSAIADTVARVVQPITEANEKLLGRVQSLERGMAGLTERLVHVDKRIASCVSDGIAASTSTLEEKITSQTMRAEEFYERVAKVVNTAREESFNSAMEHNRTLKALADYHMETYHSLQNQMDELTERLDNEGKATYERGGLLQYMGDSTSPTGRDAERPLKKSMYYQLHLNVFLTVY